MPAVIVAPGPDAFKSILTDDCLAFLAFLHRNFESRRQELLRARIIQSGLYDGGVLPTFLPETAQVRSGNWRCASIPADLLDRRVEITGPVDRKMVINALNSGASTYMADMEDSTAPTWFNLVDGQINLRDAILRQIDFKDTRSGKEYKLNSKVATLLIRPRGWHLSEGHVLVDDQPMSGSLFDFGVYFFTNARALLAQNSGPYYYLPKMQSYLEARLWNDVFAASQAYIGIPHGTVRATCLIETLPAAFQMDEILYELRDHSAGLNCGRWDYIFSYIKTLRAHKEFVLPDRSQVTMTAAFMAAYVKLLIRTCHRRGTFAMGGMAAQIPIKEDKEANDRSMAAVRQDKLREVQAGHDGTWVAHPALVDIAMDVFSKEMKGPNQIYYIPEAGKDVTPHDMLAPSAGTISMDGVVDNVRASLAYTEAWLRGVGCIPLNHKMEDAATAEISRAQLWQWHHHGVVTKEGVAVTVDLLRQIIADETQVIAKRIGANNQAARAQAIIEELCLGPLPGEFITTRAYPHILSKPKSKL